MKLGFFTKLVLFSLCWLISGKVAVGSLEDCGNNITLLSSPHLDIHDAWIEALEKGNRQAFGDFFVQFKYYLKKVVVRTTMHFGTVNTVHLSRILEIHEDVLQDLMLTLYRRRLDYSPQWRFTTWLAQIARGVVTNQRRRNYAFRRGFLFSELGAQDSKSLDSILEDHRAQVEPNDSLGSRLSLAVRVDDWITNLPESRRAQVMRIWWEAQLSDLGEEDNYLPIMQEVIGSAVSRENLRQHVDAGLRGLRRYLQELGIRYGNGER